MRYKLLIFFAVLNTVVLGIGFLCLGYIDKTARLKAQAAATAAVAAKPPVPPQPQPAPKTIVVYKTNQFKWSQLETPDYRQYIANLRAIGCPELTIRDLIMTDVMRLYAQRRGQYYQNGRQFKFWETDDKRKLKAKQLEEREIQLAQIDKELPGVLRELLGVNYERELNKYFVDSNEDARRLAFLSDDKREQTIEIREQWEAKRDQLLEQARNGPLSAADIAQLRQFEQERDKALSGILTAEEMNLYDLSTSETANRLRDELIGFNPTEKEFREIYAKQKALDEKYAFQNMDDEAVRQAKAAEEQAMTEDLKKTLGEGRAADLQQSKNPEYRELVSLSEQYDLPTDTSQNLIEMRQIAQDQIQRLVQDNTIPLDRRQQALKEIQTETERSFQKTLGSAAYSAYVQGAGSWIRSVGGSAGAPASSVNSVAPATQTVTPSQPASDTETE